MALGPGMRVGPYEVVAPLGAGGMGEVYRARDERLSRDVALKVLPPSFSSDPERLRRFEQEARATGALNHPHILAVHDTGYHDGAPYVVSKLLEGQSCVSAYRAERCPPARPSRSAHRSREVWRRPTTRASCTATSPAARSLS